MRFLARLVLSLLANTVGFLAASLFLDNFHINASSFVQTIIVFSIVSFIIGPFMLAMAIKNMPFLVGGIALVTTLMSLIITDIFTDGFSVTGLSTWALSTLIIWIFAIIANLVLPLFLFKKTIQKTKQPKSAI